MEANLSLESAQLSLFDAAAAADAKATTNVIGLALFALFWVLLLCSSVPLFCSSLSVVVAVFAHSLKR